MVRRAWASLATYLWKQNEHGAGLRALPARRRHDARSAARLRRLHDRAAAIQHGSCTERFNASPVTRSGGVDRHRTTTFARARALSGRALLHRLHRRSSSFRLCIRCTLYFLRRGKTWDLRNEIQPFDLKMAPASDSGMEIPLLGQHRVRLRLRIQSRRRTALGRTLPARQRQLLRGRMSSMRVISRARSHAGRGPGGLARWRCRRPGHRRRTSDFGYIDSARIFRSTSPPQDAQQRFDRQVQGWRTRRPRRRRRSRSCATRCGIRRRSCRRSSGRRRRRRCSGRSATTSNSSRTSGGRRAGRCRRTSAPPTKSLGQIRAAVEKIAADKGLTLVLDAAGGIHRVRRPDAGPHLGRARRAQRPARELRLARISEEDAHDHADAGASSPPSSAAKSWAISTMIRGVAGIREALPGDITFLANARYERYLAETRAAAVICAREPRTATAAAAAGGQPLPGVPEGRARVPPRALPAGRPASTPRPWSRPTRRSARTSRSGPIAWSSAALASATAPC